jgi:hypothetical protein
LQANRSEALDLLGVGDLNLPTTAPERVVHEAGSGHRLDHGADRSAVELVDWPGEGLQRLTIWRADQPVELVAL